ncbi:hypothetical protein VC83_00426 [Pseudogymnoascus destructans]|uniref:PH domain-containing protein n=2 Tax=Pseudogymnoascus destructans TaxID=655981 RepID=L8G790_PSED2|nr:uncharacterized protein VC83_00426 [Pseudogymnoascus destructans]ELR08518.1 hypothetical protein GMDG_03217 [Pseudogymnoascus destructans 20631-21]OAF63485.1 hypothetical protein VC83_00426 [Pseudogymnoascus destructans]
MEGYLLVPPERSAIIGRAVWKPRYVVLGTNGPRHPTAPKPSLPRSISARKLHAARQGLKTSSVFQSSDDLTRVDQDQLWLTVTKQKGDSEIISHNLLSSIRSCEIQSIQFRKPGPAVPTLILTFELDAASERLRKRRSSRSGQLTSPSSTFPNSLLFRPMPDDRFDIYDWQVTIAPRIRPATAERGDASSNDSASLFAFVNPFGNSQKQSERPTISNPIPQPEPFLHHRTSTKGHRPPPKPISLISPSPSLRSRHSDLSSPTSSFSPSGPLPIQHPPLPSPASTLNHDGDLISSWTSAQGRSSALSHYTHASTPPTGPRETILDRAFSMRYIPGAADAPPPSEEGKLSSIARFEALMRDHEARKNRPATPTHNRNESVADWDIDEAPESDDSDIDRVAPNPRTQNARRVDTPSDDPLTWSMHTISAPTQRALGYISGRTTPATGRPGSARSEDHPPMPTMRARPGEGGRAIPASLSLAGMGTRVIPPAPRTVDTAEEEEEDEDEEDDEEESDEEDEEEDDREVDLYSAAFPQPPSNPLPRSRTAPPTRPPLYQRHSSASSCLPVQTNVSSAAASSRNSRNSDASSGFGLPEAETVLVRGLSQARLSRLVRGTQPGVLQRGMSEESRCGGGWRGGGMLGGVEGGFM